MKTHQRNKKSTLFDIIKVRKREALWNIEPDFKNLINSCVEKGCAGSNCNKEFWFIPNNQNFLKRCVKDSENYIKENYTSRCQKECCQNTSCSIDVLYPISIEKVKDDPVNKKKWLTDKIKRKCFETCTSRYKKSISSIYSFMLNDKLKKTSPLALIKNYNIELTQKK